MAEGAGAPKEQVQTDKDQQKEFVFRVGILCELQIEAALLRRQVAET